MNQSARQPSWYKPVLTPLLKEVAIILKDVEDISNSTLTEALMKAQSILPEDFRKTEKACAEYAVGNKAFLLEGISRINSALQPAPSVSAITEQVVSPTTKAITTSRNKGGVKLWSDRLVLTIIQEAVKVYVEGMWRGKSSPFSLSTMFLSMQKKVVPEGLWRGRDAIYSYVYPNKVKLEELFKRELYKFRTSKNMSEVTGNNVVPFKDNGSYIGLTPAPALVQSTKEGTFVSFEEMFTNMGKNIDTLINLKIKEAALASEVKFEALEAKISQYDSKIEKILDSIPSFNTPRPSVVKPQELCILVVAKDSLRSSVAVMIKKSKTFLFVSDTSSPAILANHSKLADVIIVMEDVRLNIVSVTTLKSHKKFIMVGSPDELAEVIAEEEDKFYKGKDALISIPTVPPMI